MNNFWKRTPYPGISITGGSSSDNGHSGITIVGSASNISIDGMSTDRNGKYGIEIISVEKHNMIAALYVLKGELASIGVVPAVEAIIAASEAELNEPVPNKSRLMSYVDSLRTMTEGALDLAPKLPAAIKAVEKMIRLLPF